MFKVFSLCKSAVLFADICLYFVMLIEFSKLTDLLYLCFCPSPAVLVVALCFLVMVP